MAAKFFNIVLPESGSAALAAAISTLLLIVGCAAAPTALENEPMLSSSEERMLWRRAAEQQETIFENGKLYDRPDTVAYANRVADALRPKSCPPALKFKVYITSDPFMNAHAYPDGGIFITTGLLARLENEAQLAAVLSHEMAHCIERDALRAYRRCASLQPEERLAGRQETHSESGSQSGAARGGCLSELVRRRESAADARGLDMLVQAKYDPQEALRVFRHQKQALALDGGTNTNDSGSHPLWNQRMHALEQLLSTAGQSVDSGKRGRAAYEYRIQPLLLFNARLNLRFGRHRWARMDLKRYLQIRPEDARALHLLGEAYRQQGGRTGIENARACYLAAIRLDGSYAPPHKALGMLLFKQGRRQTARRYFQTALALAPGDPDSAYITAYLAECQ